MRNVSLPFAFTLCFGLLIRGTGLLGPRMISREGLPDRVTAAALEEKLKISAQRYPIAKARGNNRKYTELE